jgi:endo-1,4-beta-xylanase
MKWERIHPKPGGADSYDFAAADEIVSFAAARGFVVRGHTLVWHQQVPGWVFGDAAETLSRMKDHITTLVSRYRGSVFCWDVVNEAVSDDGGWRTDSPWYRAAGSDRDEDGIPDYIVRAFEYARAADPQAKLFYNDYNIEAGLKLERAFSLARALAARGLIDGIGIQGHWSIWDPDPRTVGAAIRRFASLGLEVHITELDLSVYRWGDVASLDSLPAPLEEMQAKRYAELFGVFREEASAGRLAAVTFWGIADDYTWLDQFPVKGRKNWPLLFDEHHRPKQAFWSVVRW